MLRSTRLRRKLARVRWADPACVAFGCQRLAFKPASKQARWRRIQVTVYGKTVFVRVLVIDALWYVAAGSELMRLVVVGDFPGHEKDDVFVSTDPTPSPRQIVEGFSVLRAHHARLPQDTQ